MSCQSLTPKLKAMVVCEEQIILKRWLPRSRMLHAVDLRVFSTTSVVRVTQGQNTVQLMLSFPSLYESRHSSQVPSPVSQAFANAASDGSLISRAISLHENFTSLSSAKSFARMLNDRNGVCSSRGSVGRALDARRGH